MQSRTVLGAMLCFPWICTIMHILLAPCMGTGTKKSQTQSHVHLSIFYLQMTLTSHREGIGRIWFTPMGQAFEGSWKGSFVQTFEIRKTKECVDFANQWRLFPDEKVDGQWWPRLTVFSKWLHCRNCFDPKEFRAQLLVSVFLADMLKKTAWKEAFCYKLPGGMQLLGMESSQGNCC